MNAGKRRNRWWLMFLASALAYGADAPSYSKTVAPLLAQRCSGCHSSAAHMGGLTVDSFDALLKGGGHGKAIVPGNAGESRLFLMISGKISPSMPMDGGRLKAEDIEAVKVWIDAGAVNDGAGQAISTEIPTIAPKVAGRPQIFDLAWRPDGSVIAVAGYREVRLFDPAAKREIARLGGAAGAVRSVVFSRDGKLLAAAGGLPAQRGEVQIWDVEARKLIQTISGHADCIYAVTFSADGKSVATASYDKLIKLWDITSASEVRTFKDHIDAVYALIITPDGKHLISGAADRTVKLWDVATGERLYTLSDAQDGINAIALDPTGPRLAAGGLDKTIRIWTLGEKGGTLEHTYIAHEDAILRLTWSPDGKTLVSSSADGSIKLLNASDLSEVKAIAEQPDWVYGLKFSPDGSRFAAGRFDGSLVFYDR